MGYDIFEMLCKEKGVKPIDVSKATGISTATLSSWKAGKYKPKTDKMALIAAYFEVSVDFMEGRTDQRRPAKPEWQDAEGFFREIEANEPPDHVWVPIVGRVAAGQPMYAEDNIEGYLVIGADEDEYGPLFALRIAGDSMEPEIKKGSIAIVRPQEDADTGDVVIVHINGEDATCKRIKKTAAGLTLLPANPAYDMQSYTWAEVAETPVSIVGKVIEVRTKY